MLARIKTSMQHLSVIKGNNSTVWGFWKDLSKTKHSVGRKEFIVAKEDNFFFIWASYIFWMEMESFMTLDRFQELGEFDLNSAWPELSHMEGTIPTPSPCSHTGRFPSELVRMQPSY